MGILTPFLILSAAEIAVFLLVSGAIGFWLAALLLLATSVAGGALLRRLGISTLRRAQLQLEQGQITPDEIVTGLWLAAAGILLLIPGFLTDLAGLALFLPASRRWVGRWLVGRYRAHATSPVFRQGPDWTGATAPAPPGSNPRQPETPRPPMAPLQPGPVIDVEFEDLPPKP